MNGSFQVRRATLEDLGQLRSLWSKVKLDPLSLEKRLTEFQVIESNGIVASIGIQVASQQGLVHSEALSNFTQRDQLAPILWKRIQALTRNHGLHRLWIDEADPCWMQFGFVPATAAQIKKLPPEFGSGKEWHVIQLKDESIATLSLEQELELFSQAQRQSTEDILRQARRFKQFAYALLWLAVAGLVALLLYTFRHPVEMKRLPKPPALGGTNPPASRI